jgi:soluble lytic murein transglycosylase-like protein
MPHAAPPAILTAALVLAVVALVPAQAQVATAVTAAPLSGGTAALPGLTITLESLPRPATPPPETGPVVAPQVEGWRKLAHALEHGDGMPADPVRAAELYCRAARYGDAEAQFSLAWMLTNARGIQRNDAEAAHLFAAAAEQGMAQATNMIARMGTPLGPPPPCLRPPEGDPLAQPAVAAAPVRPGAAPAPRSGVAGAATGGTGFRPMPPPPQAPEVIVRFVELVAPEYQLSPSLVLAVMARESNFDPMAESPKKAQGLMQLIPDTARRFGVRNATDPVQNMRGGMAYLRWLLAHFRGDVALALAGYNAGEGAVNRYRGVPPFAETRFYVRRILADLGGQRFHPFDAAAAPPSEMLAQPGIATVQR